MACVSTSKMSVLWNGEKTDCFRIETRGSYRFRFFVLCMERLGHIIDREVCSGNWKPIYVGRGLSPVLC